MNEALDFKTDSEAVASIIQNLSDADYKTITQFKGWTIYDIIAHLHLWNMAADWTLSDPKKFMAFIKGVLKSGKSHQEVQRGWCADEGLETGRKLFKAWSEGFSNLAEKYALADPDKRVKWAGPDMSVRSCIIARQMETWAHAQAIFDALGLERRNDDRIKNIAHIGVTTYSWSFKVNDRTPILPKPYVRLTSPSGEIWEWNEPHGDGKVEGLAVEFSQVVTQCRNILDTSLVTTGEAARTWMEMAQCFAGSPEPPPAKGQRYKL